MKSSGRITLSSWQRRPTSGHRSYRFRLGDYERISVSDGAKDYALAHFFANAPRPKVEAALRCGGLPTDGIVTPYTHLIVETDEHRVLVHLWAGSMAATTGTMVANLRATGIGPADIDVVSITHAHPDHIGGTLDADGQLVYACARYYIREGE